MIPIITQEPKTLLKNQGTIITAKINTILIPSISRPYLSNVSSIWKQKF